MPGVFEGTFEFKTGYFNAKDVRFMREKVDKEDHLKEELVNMDCREMVSHFSLVLYVKLSTQ